MGNHPLRHTDGTPELRQALLDALSFCAAGFPNVTASYGVNGFTDELFEAVRSSGAERVLIAYDRDEAGDRGAEAVARRRAAEGPKCFRVRFPWRWMLTRTPWRSRRRSGAWASGCCRRCTWMSPWGAEPNERRSWAARFFHRSPGSG
jgi:hypothetical protein